CGEFRDKTSGSIVHRRTPARREGRPTLNLDNRIFKNGILTLLLVVMGLALLYAYRSQTPAVPVVAYSQAVQDVQAGKVKQVTEIANKATLDLKDNTKEQATLPDNSKTDPLQDAVTA